MSEKLKLILENAIRDEEYFHMFYKVLAKRLDDESMKEKLLNLSEQERMHKEKLESLNFEQLEETIIADKISEIDVADEVALTPVENFKDIQEMLAFAIKQEVIAELTYEKLATSTNDEEAKKLFKMFAGEEKKHKLLLTGELAVINN